MLLNSLHIQIVNLESYEALKVLLFIYAFSFLLGPYLIIIKQQLNGTADTKN